MLSTDDFGPWVEEVNPRLEMTDANRDKVEKLFRTWEASKAVAEQTATLYNEKLANDQFGEMTEEEAAELRRLLAREAVASPGSMERRQKAFERMQKLPQEIAAAEAELTTLAGTSAGADTLRKEIDDAKAKQEAFKKALAEAPKAQVGILEGFTYRKEKKAKVDFAAEVTRLEAEGKTDKESVDRLAQLRRFQKRAEREETETKFGASFREGRWDDEVKRLDAEIVELGVQVKTKEDSKKLLDALPEKIRKLKEETAKLRRETLSKIPIHAKAHASGVKRFTRPCLPRRMRQNPDVIDSVVAEFKRLKELKRPVVPRATILPTLASRRVNMRRLSTDRRRKCSVTRSYKRLRIFRQVRLSTGLNKSLRR